MKYKALLLKFIAIVFLQFIISASFYTASKANNAEARKMLKNNLKSKASQNKFDVTITGKIVDQKTNNPIAGATVKVKNSTTSTITDENGNYKITVPNEQAVLVFSYVGFESQEKLVGDLKTINMYLVSS